MAESGATDVIPDVTIDNVNASVNATGKIPATPEGMAIAYGSLVVMAVLPIFFGAFRSVNHHKEQQKNATQPGAEKPETMTHKDAAMFPVVASCALFGLYCFFRIFSKEYINILLTSYFFFLGVLALSHIISPYFIRMIPEGLFENTKYQLLFLEEKKPDEENKENTEQSKKPMTEVINYQFCRKELISLLCCFVVGLWYLWKKHWIANNLFGLAFSVNGVELLQLNSVSTGCILLGGLFIYDIFWVFGTDVMVTVAKSFEAPIKLVFPQDLLEHGLSASNFAMLGLGDIVIPGIFIALLLRFDVSQKKEGSRVYFYAGFLAYILGLLGTIFVMHYYKHAQPALLYLVPACIGLPLGLAVLRGEIKQLFAYEDHSEEDLEKKDDNKKEK